MEKMLLVALSLSGLTVGSEGMFRKYHYVDTALSWWEAQAHCRREFVDLATVTDQEDADALLRALPAAGIYAWIGLQDDLTKWSWSMTNMSFNNNTDYSNWEKETMDNSKSRDKCALMKSSGTWLDQPCEEEQPSVCYDEDGLHTYVFVNQSMNWRDAKKFCRDHHTDLAVVRSSSENGRVAALLPADAWMGLSRRSWKKWSDQTRVAFTVWAEGQPSEESAVATCGAAGAETATWWDDDCNWERSFICYSVLEARNARVKLKLRSEADLTAPDNDRQMLEQVQ